MASWLKQGLSTLGEGLATLTKEIISEEPPDAPLSRSSKPSRSATPNYDVTSPVHEIPLQSPVELTGDASEINNLRQIILELEERTRSAEASANHNQQLIRNYETHMISMRDQIFDLQSQLERSKQKGNAHAFSDKTEDESQKYVDVDLSKSPSPSRNRFPSLSDTDMLHAQETALENSKNMKILEQRNSELELQAEKNEEIIDDLNEKVSALESEVGKMKWEFWQSPDKIDAETQFAQQESSTGREVIDGSVQTDTTEVLLNEAASTDSVPSAEREPEIKDANSFCFISLGVNDGSSQTSSSPDIPSVAEVSDQSCQSDMEDLKLVRSRVETVDRETQSDDVTFWETPHIDKLDQEVQWNAEMQLPAAKEISSQTERFLAAASSQTSHEEEPTKPELFENETQTDEAPRVSAEEAGTQWEYKSADVAVETVPSVGEEGFTQTESIPVASEEKSCQSGDSAVDFADASVGMDIILCEDESQSEIVGDVVGLEQLQTSLQQEQLLRSELEAAVSLSDRLKKEGERLRAHLVKVEQAYAQDFETVQIREDELRKVIEQLQSQVLSMSVSQEQSSTEITEHVCRLQEQVNVLDQARDEAVAKLHESEKRNHQIQASLSNLRMAVEHSKREHQAELAMEREKSRKTLLMIEKELQEFQQNNAQLYMKVAELEKDRSITAQLTVETELLRQRTSDLLKQLDEKDVYLSKALDDAATVSGNKVDKALLRSMVFGYFAGPKSTQNDIIRMLMVTLDFSESEKQKVQTAQSGGLRSLFASSSNKPGHAPDDTFSNMLVKFIEQESGRKSDATTGVVSTAPSFPSAAGLFDPVRGSSSRQSTPVGMSSFLSVSDESADKQDQVLRKILDTAPVPDQGNGVDTV